MEIHLFYRIWEGLMSVLKQTLFDIANLYAHVEQLSVYVLKLLLMID